MRNPYKVVLLKTGNPEAKIYGVQYKDYPGVAFPDSWGTKAHALEYMAALLGLTYEEYRKANNGTN